MLSPQQFSCDDLHVVVYRYAVLSHLAIGLEQVLASPCDLLSRNDKCDMQNEDGTAHRASSS
jgi:hypothetical protein